MPRREIVHVGPSSSGPKISHAGSVEVEGDGSSNLAVGKTRHAEVGTVAVYGKL